MLPRGILMDLDDTLITYGSGIDHRALWKRACEVHLPARICGEAERLVDAIQRQASWYWSDPDRHRIGRLDLPAARTAIVREALTQAGAAVDEQTAWRIQHEFDSARSAVNALFPEAVDTLRLIRELGIGLVLITNGASEPQREKLERFALTDAFDAVLIEGEFGAGKPDPSIYLHALELLSVKPDEAWIVGDNYEWEIAAPGRLGIRGVWINSTGMPPSGAAEGAPQPFLTVKSIGEFGRYLRSLPPSENRS